MKFLHAFSCAGTRGSPFKEHTFCFFGILFGHKRPKQNSPFCLQTSETKLWAYAYLTIIYWLGKSGSQFQLWYTEAFKYICTGLNVVQILTFEVSFKTGRSPWVWTGYFDKFQRRSVIDSGRLLQHPWVCGWNFTINPQTCAWDADFTANSKHMPGLYLAVSSKEMG